MPQKRLTSADHYIYHSVTQRYNIPSQLDSIFISFTHNVPVEVEVHKVPHFKALVNAKVEL